MARTRAGNDADREGGAGENRVDHGFGPGGGPGDPPGRPAPGSDGAPGGLPPGGAEANGVRPAGHNGRSDDTTGFLESIASAATGAPPDDDAVRLHYPRLYQLLSKRFDTDGRLLRAATISVRAEGEAWTATISVPWAKVTASVSVQHLHDLFQTVEDALGRNRGQWRLQRGFKLKKGS